MRVFWLTILCLLPMRLSAAPPTLEELLRPSQHGIVRMSPGGQYIAATLRQEQNNKNRVLLVVYDRATNKPIRVLDPEEKAEISAVSWANDQRLFVRSAWGGDTFEQYYTDPRIFAVNVDGSHTKVFNTAIVDMLADDDEHVLIEVCARSSSKGCLSYVARIDNDMSRNREERLIDAPDTNVDFVTDNAGNVRFAFKEDDDRVQTVWKWDGGKWQPFHDSKTDGTRISFVGTTRDSSAAFLWTERADGPDVIERYEFATGERKVVMSDPMLDPAFIVRSADGRQPIGAAYGLGVPRARFWDPSDPDAKLLRGLEKAFPEDAVKFDSGSRDGQHIVISVWSDRDPGSFYLLDRATRQTTLLARVKPWLDPSTLARSEPIAFASRDGVQLHGYLTLPATPTTQPSPLVVMPHGGPFGVRDEWDYEEEVQILAAQGYAVLRVNFRGSSGFGLAFTRSGYRQWGGRILDDILDATHWAAADGRIDPKRACIWGTSFGGYAALMSAVREPALFKCAISSAGVTNLITMRKWGDIQRSEWGRNYLDEAVGNDEAALFEQSPVKHAARIQAQVLLVHGRHDELVSFEHARQMEEAMQKAGKPMETLFFGDETHGIYGYENQLKYYGRVLAFLRKHLGEGGEAAAAVGGGSANR